MTMPAFNYWASYGFSPPTSTPSGSTVLPPWMAMPSPPMMSAFRVPMPKMMRTEVEVGQNVGMPFSLSAPIPSSSSSTNGKENVQILPSSTVPPFPLMMPPQPMMPFGMSMPKKVKTEVDAGEHVGMPVPVFGLSAPHLVKTDPDSPILKMEAESPQIQAGQPKRKSVEPKVCKVCGDSARATYYGVDMCDGCYNFFYRTIKYGNDQKPEFQCIHDGENRGSCTIRKTTRTRCQFCRFMACQNAGLDCELVRQKIAAAKGKQQPKSKFNRTVYKSLKELD